MTMKALERLPWIQLNTFPIEHISFTLSIHRMPHDLHQGLEDFRLEGCTRGGGGTELQGPSGQGNPAVSNNTDKTLPES